LHFIEFDKSMVSIKFPRNKSIVRAYNRTKSTDFYDVDRILGRKKPLKFTIYNFPVQQHRPRLF
jgi:hypothetical protein